MSKPPKETPIIQKPTPVVLDELLIEERDSNESRYDRMLEYGHIHPNRAVYPNYRFLKAEPTDYGGMRYYWANDQLSQDCYNASKKYSAEGNAFPIFTRSYRVLRSDYLANGPSTKLLPFTGVVTVKITNQGTGYTKDFAVTFSGSGSGAAGIAIVDTASGKVVYIAMTAVGSGYTAAPTVVLSAGDGTGAAATSYIQPATALLVKEEHSKLDDSDPFSSLYDRLVMTWETLPGPILHGSQTDKVSGIVADYQKQLVASGTVSGGVTGAGVLTLRIANAGHDFTAGTYNLAFSGGGGTGAAGTYTVTAPSPSGKIGSVTLVNHGGGFTGMPTASISGGGGSGATVTVVLVGSTIASLLLLSTDSNFVGTPTITITDSAGTGTGATGAALLTPTSVASGTVVNAGSGYTSATAVISGGGGTGATATVTVAGNVVTAIVITASGTGYTSTPTIVITGDGTGATAAIVLTATSVASVSVSGTGSNYQNPSVTCTDGSGTAVLSAFLRPTSISSLSLNNPGSGYSAPVLTISGGGGSGATGTATLASGTIVSLALTNPGADYTSNPTVTAPSGGGSGASIIATIGSTTYVEIEPQDTCIDLVMRTTINLATLPATKTYPISQRVQRSDFSIAGLIIFQANSQIAVGLNDTNLQGGSGPVKAWVDEHYMTESQYAAFDPGVFSISGQSESYTLSFSWGDPSPHVFTGRVTPVSQGTTAGVLDVRSESQKYGVRLVYVTYLTQSY